MNARDKKLEKAQSQLTSLRQQWDVTNKRVQGYFDTLQEFKDQILQIQQEALFMSGILSERTWSYREPIRVSREMKDRQLYIYSGHRSDWPIIDTLGLFPWGDGIIAPRDLPGHFGGIELKTNLGDVSLSFATIEIAAEFIQEQNLVVDWSEAKETISTLRKEANAIEKYLLLVQANGSSQTN